MAFQRLLTAALNSYPTDFCGNVSCQNGILLFVVVNERRHLGHRCAINYWRIDSDFNGDIRRYRKGRKETSDYILFIFAEIAMEFINI